VSIANYDELKAAVAKWLSRRADLADVIPDFIALGEARMARDLRLHRQVVTGTLNALAGVATVALPENWLEFQHIKIAGRVGSLDLSTPGAIEADYASTETGVPQKFAIRGDTVLLGPTPDVDYALPASWYERIPALSAEVASTWLLAAHPGVYLWAALAEAGAFLPGDKRVALWESKYAAEVAQVLVADERARFGGGQIHQVAR
jgi:hypothetical protein